MPKAIVLLSGGLDSATTLYYALDRGFEVRALVFDYGQRHRREIRAARAVARAAGVPCQVVRIAFPWKGSALLDSSQKVPTRLKIGKDAIPSTYVPARNIIFVSFAASFAEAVGAREIFIGANAIDYSGYPDCRPEFFAALQKAFDKGLKAGVEKRGVSIRTPLVHLTKAEIVRLGTRLKVPYDKTWSCYNNFDKPCGTCDSCRLRARGFKEAGEPDPLSGVRQKGASSRRVCQ
ncbi:MAG: 7-cyano-7-deazaguanine synthase QueC [Candidatus Omnitrophica bacterium]|nr:7-cyano-7-deazaguanine synthase QueC [Candidatus Omnitrophota bacterium]